MVFLEFVGCSEYFIAISRQTQQNRVARRFGDVGPVYRHARALLVAAGMAQG